MDILGKRRRWWLEKYVAFEQIIAEGNSVLNLLWTKARDVITYVMILSGVSVGAEQGFGMEIFDQLPDWLGWIRVLMYFIFRKAIFILPLVPIVELAKDFGLGMWSRHSKLWHIKQEWAVKRGLSVITKEMLNRIREIHTKECPESQIPKRGYGYIEEDKESEIKKQK